MIDTNDAFVKDLIHNLNRLNSAIFHPTDSHLDSLHKKNYINHFKEWLVEKAIKNQKIKHKQKNENVKRPRQRIYWVEFGLNVGSEFSFPHFGVVIKEFNHTVIVVPLSSEKVEDPEYKNSGNLFVPIGEISGLPYNKKPCYALVNQIKTLSRTRLSDYRDPKTKKYIELNADKDQMKLIFDAIKNIILTSHQYDDRPSYHHKLPAHPSHLLKILKVFWYSP